MLQALIRSEVLLMSTHSIYFCAEIRKIGISTLFLSNAMKISLTWINEWILIFFFFQNPITKHEQF